MSHSQVKQPGIWFLLLLAATPFFVKGMVLWIGLTGYILQSLYKLFQLLIPACWRWRFDSIRGLHIFWPIDEPLPELRTWLIAVVAAMLLSLMSIIMLQWLIPLWGIDPGTIRAGLDTRFSVGPLGAVLVVVFLSLINSAIEELHFRAWLDMELSRYCNNAAGIVISATAFGGMHALIFWGLPGFSASLLILVSVFLAVAGAVWSGIMRLKGGIHATLLSHVLTDVLVLGWGLKWLGYL